jgi:hypothetical protein
VLGVGVGGGVAVALGVPARISRFACNVTWWADGKQVAEELHAEEKSCLHVNMIPSGTGFIIPPPVVKHPGYPLM